MAGHIHREATSLSLRSQLQPERTMENSSCAVSETECKQDSLTYCVTGSTGYIGSWLVRSLLQRGYNVNATARDPAKISQFLSLWNGGNRLNVYISNLDEEGSFDQAVKGCHGVFHVAASMEFNVSTNENIESYVQSHILDPAIKGTLNLLKSCTRAGSVKRVVFTSSISTITGKDRDGKWKPIVDESCQTPIGHVWNGKASGWVYVLSKLLSEEAAFKFANENGIDLVSIITTTVAGPFLTPTVPASIRLLLSPITGESEYSSILKAVHNRMGSISLVHIDDICNAHVFLMEEAAAEGKYICSAHSCVMSQLLDCLAHKYFPFGQHRCGSSERLHESIPAVISSKKLEDLGFKFKFGIEELMEQSISCCLQHGFLKQSNSDCSYSRTEATGIVTCIRNQPRVLALPTKYIRLFYKFQRNQQSHSGRDRMGF